MNAKLIKKDSLYELYKVQLDKNVLIGSSDYDAKIMAYGKDIHYKLSKQNCEAIANGYDVYELAKENYHKFWPIIDESGLINHTFGYVEGFNKAMELNKDKVFTLEQVLNAFYAGWISKDKTYPEAQKSYKGYLERHVMQPTEIEVEIEMELHPTNHASGLELTGNEFMDFAISENYKPKLDSEGCLILKKI
jgi:hypothetical protein